MKKSNENLMTDRSQNLLIFFCWLIYTIAYTGRYSVNANINLIIEDYSVSHTEAGLIVTCFFFAYGIGQLVNGILCKRYNLKWVFPIVFIISSVLNIIMFIGVPFAVIPYLWLINGFVQSFLWSSLVRALSEGLDEKHIQKSIVVLGTTTPFGTFLSYGVCALFVKFGNYRLSFLFGAVCMTAVGILWLLTYKPGARKAAEENSAPSEKVSKTAKVMLLLPIVLGIFAVIDNFVKDGVQTWAPVILKETFHVKDEYSIILTLALPLIGALSAWVIIKVKKVITDFVAMCAMFFALATGFILGIILMHNSSMTAFLILFSLVELAMHCICNIITSMAPLYMRDEFDSGMLAGIMNCCCYLGSTLSSVGLGAVADNAGWSAVFTVMTVSCLVCIGIFAVYKALTKRRAK